MNTYFQIKIVKDGQPMTLTTPQGIVDLDTALSSISYLQPFDLVDYRKKEGGGW